MKQKIKRCSFVVALCLLVTGCQSAEQAPQITQDSLSTPSLAQQTMEQVAANGKTYAYVWDAEDIDATVKRYAETVTTSSPQGSDNEKDTDELIEQYLNDIRQSLEKEQALQPIVGAQEAANIAGIVMEEQYGADFSVAPISLSCYEGDTSLTTQPNPNAQTRLIWFASAEDKTDGLFPNICTISLDATTGEIISANSYLSQTLSNEYKAAPSAACIDKETRILNEQDPSYESTKEAFLQQATQLLTQNPLLGDATIQSITFTNDALKGARIDFTTSAGKKGCLIITYPDPTFGFGGAPMRAYRYENLSWFEAYANSPA